MQLFAGIINFQNSVICVKISLNFWDNTRLENMEYSSVEREMEAEALQSIYGEEIVSVKRSEENQPVSYEVNFQQSKTKIIFTLPGEITFLH